ncbi:Peptidase S8, subtilisin-related protein [Metarhizium robertsii ARSEF 23]|uniref:Peptidase S8, subtilisin-related protein n=1 Tax=Metarhizium robertsii (strain ARSEF 23 / ATCC MYA-3075) TaxID=655844 RepID=E9EK68_METRA|nr:Peptidase S8, subtilisin-related protein [Metarhizium robertsii ARSEF 23]EFZ03408.1 Peptidase S8, subtilisin-related protein [Metarhizium robertsii ARSEF 23]
MSSRTPGLKPYRHPRQPRGIRGGGRAALGFNADGPSVDIFAPGVDVMSSDTGSGKATRLVSDTSLAALHIAGLALYLIATKTAAKLWARILALATKDKIANLPAETCSLLAYNGAEQAVSAGRGLGSS